jgi:hypothetical protein
MKLPLLRFREAELRLASEQLGKRETFEKLFPRMRDKPTPTERQAYRDLERDLTAELRAGITSGKYGGLRRLQWHSLSGELHSEGGFSYNQRHLPFDDAARAELTRYMAENPKECTQKGATKWARRPFGTHDRDTVVEFARTLSGYHKEKRGRKPKPKLGG